MPHVLDTKWWGWGSRDESSRFPAPSALWKFLDQKLGPLSAHPPIGSLDEIYLPPSRLDADDVVELQTITGEDGVSIEAHERAVHSLGKSYPDLIRMRQGEIPRPTDAVVYPQSEAQVESILKLSQERRWRIIPFGGGTSVVGGVEPGADSRPAITVDLEKLNRVTAIDTVSGSLRLNAASSDPGWRNNSMPVASPSVTSRNRSSSRRWVGGWQRVPRASARRSTEKSRTSLPASVSPRRWESSRPRRFQRRQQDRTCSKCW